MSRQTIPELRPICESCGNPVNDYRVDDFHRRIFGATVYVAHDGTVAHVECPPRHAPSSETGDTA